MMNKSSSNLHGKRILFLAPAFFGYEKLIAKKLRDLGASVDLYDERSINSALARALLKIAPWLFLKRTVSYYKTIIKDNINKDYDYVFVIKCDMIPRSTLTNLKKVFPNAKFCLYLYDSIKNISNIKSKFKYFDSIYSFDMNDCEKYFKLKFRPLFFAEQFRKNVKTDGVYKYDISFLGTIHSDRFAVIKQVQNIAQNLGLSCYWFLYLQSKFIYCFYKLTKKEFWNVKANTFSFDKMSAESIAKIVDESRIVLDTQHPRQTGLTMRTIEMIGMNKKLITTNTSIKKYDFFNEKNVAVVDRKNIKISKQFLESPYIPLPDDIYEKYSLESWILEVLS